MPTIQEWREIFKGYDTVRLKKIVQALKVLQAEPDIKEQYIWTGLFILRELAQQEIERKGKECHPLEHDTTARDEVCHNINKMLDEEAMHHADEQYDGYGRTHD